MSCSVSTSESAELVRSATASGAQPVAAHPQLPSLYHSPTWLVHFTPHCVATRMGYSPLLNQGLSNQMLGGGANFAPQAPAYNPQGFNAQQYGIGAGASAAAPQPNLAQPRMQAFQMPQPATTFSYPVPATQPQQQIVGGYNPTASPAAIAAANQGYNNMLLGLGQGLTNLGRNMAAGPPPALVTGYALQQDGYRGATLRANYPGIGAVDLGVPKVGEGGVSATLAPSGGAELVNDPGANTISNPTSQ